MLRIAFRLSCANTLKPPKVKKSIACLRQAVNSQAKHESAIRQSIQGALRNTGEAVTAPATLAPVPFADLLSGSCSPLSSIQLGTAIGRLPKLPLLRTVRGANSLMTYAVSSGRA